jgi:D-sedoheptulose 7-phosphate isomerase
MELEKLISQTLDDSILAKRKFWEDSKASFMQVGRLLSDLARAGEGKVLIFGNGGSACDALHFSGEWVNRFSRDRKPLACISLTADAPLLTCIGNDYAFDHVFERQVLALGRPGDVAIGISTSGNSKNVILGFQAARKVGMKSVALLGGTGGKILQERLADMVLNVSASKSTPRIQETHEWILHSLCELVDFELLGPKPA